MRSGALAVLVALAVGGAAGWLLHGTGASDNIRPNAVDTVLMNNPAVKAKIDSVVQRSDSIAQASRDKDISINKNKFRADSLAAVIAARHRVPRNPTTKLTQAQPPGNTVTPTIIDTTFPDTAIILEPQTFEICKEDLNDRTGEARSLRLALDDCQIAKADDDKAMVEMRSTILSQAIWRSDTFPQLIQKERNTPRECKENWVFFKVKCGTADLIKVGGAFTLGILVAR